MSKYISSFTVGFQAVIENIMPFYLNGVKIINIFDGLVYFEYKGDTKNIESLFFLNNSFYVINVFNGSNLKFKNMILQTIRSKFKYKNIGKTFRIRYSRENQFQKVDKQITNQLEKYITKYSRLRVDRVNPDTEFWYIIRSEKVGIFCQLLKKRKFTEKNLNKGELRPELAFLICSFAKIDQKDILCDPFVGYGSILKQANKNFDFKHFIASDNDQEKVLSLKKIFSRKNISIKCIDIVNLSLELNQKIDKVITDPPWGYYENIPNIVEFYEKMFESFRNSLANNGQMIILSARKQELENAAITSKINIIDRIDTLVNGKKASIYKFQFK